MNIIMMTEVLMVMIVSVSKRSADSDAKGDSFSMLMMVYMCSESNGGSDKNHDVSDHSDGNSSSDADWTV